MKSNFMAIDQYGLTYHGLGNHPRKELIERIGSRHVSKMYQDRKDGSSVHVGYVIGQHWLTLYEVNPFERSEKPFERSGLCKDQYTIDTDSKRLRRIEQ